MSPEEHPYILYVEDDPASASLVRRVLEAVGYDVEVAPDGMAALESARHTRPSLILMDIDISGLNGYEVTTRLRSFEKTGSVPIVAVTAEGDREQALAAGCDGFISKPIDVDRFPKQIRDFSDGLREEIESSEEKAEHLFHYSQRLARRLEGKIRELEKAHGELQRVEKMKSDFILLASHELRTPLTSVYGYVQMLLQNPDIPGAPDEEGSARHLLQCIADSTKRLALVFDEIRNISLIDADRLNLAQEPVIIEPLVHTVVRDLQHFGPSRHLQFEFRGLASLPRIRGDAQRLHQALWNIISNAMKYTPDGGRISITGRCLEDTVHIMVQDTGVGIPPEEQEQIFDRFYVLEDTHFHRSSKTAFGGGGLGLGLTVAQGIIEAHGGKIWVESEGCDEQQLPGSTFHFLLPLSD